MLNIIYSAIIPGFILIVILVGILSKEDVLKLFIDGVAEGSRIVVGIFPNILAITVAINLLRETSALELIMFPIKNVINFFEIPENTLPLIILRPLSGSASTSLIIDIFTKFGVDSIEGKIGSLIMSSSETTFYVIAVLFSAAKIKKGNGTTFAAVVADIVAVMVAILLVKA
ncbi:MAG: spore maturation protein [Clostridia bacterium]|nr:spore maturation protein [Clostridia bacterium]